MNPPPRLITDAAAVYRRLLGYARPHWGMFMIGVLGMVMSVLITANVVSGAVVAGYRRIGVLKSIGFTPGQVVAAYTGQVLVSAVVGCVAGVVLGNILAIPVLAQTASVYQVGALHVPVWVDVTVPLVMCCLVAIAAVLPALRAGRLSAVQAIATGRAPRTGRGYAAHRLLGRLPLPRPPPQWRRLQRLRPRLMICASRWIRLRHRLAQRRHLSNRRTDRLGAARPKT